MVEWHSFLLLAEMLDKVLEDTSNNIETALAWCVNGKKSLIYSYGFSPFQLAWGRDQKPTMCYLKRTPCLDTGDN